MNAHHASQLLRSCATASLLAFALAFPVCANAQTPPVDTAASSAAQPPATSVPSAAAAKDASTDNPYGLEALWRGSDNVARGVLLMLVIMSAGSWYILVTKVFAQARMRGHARTVHKRFWDADTVSAGAGNLEPTSAYRFIAEAAAAAVSDPKGLRRHIPRNEWIPLCIKAAVDRVQASSQGGLAFLATVGSTSPFVGLFGTVWGIYHALTAIGLSGQASIDKVAGPVGEALIMTAIGLAVAIPAVLGYNWVVRRNKAALDEVREFADELNALVLGSTRKAA